MPRELTIDDANEDEIRSALVALAPGEALVLAGDGPERTRLEVRRRKSAAPRTVTGFLQADHERLDAIVPDVERLVDAAAAASLGTSTSRSRSSSPSSRRRRA